MIGVEFTLNDGSKDYYDPIDYPTDFEENEKYYILHMTYDYIIEKATIKNIRHYNLCNNCGHELYNNICTKCNIN